MSAFSLGRAPLGLLSEAARYTATVALGLGVNIAIGIAVHRVLGLPLPLGTGLGFLTGVAASFFAFELWVFCTRSLRWFWFDKAYLATQGAVLIRLSAVWALEWMIVRFAPGVPNQELRVLALAAGLSFVVNFLLARLLLSRS